MSFTAYVKNIQLYNDPNYKVDATLEGAALKMNFLWNERMKRYSFDLYKSDGTVIFEGVVLQSGYDYPVSNSNMIQHGLHGLFVLSPFDPDTVVTDEFYRSWADYFILTYQIIIPD